MANVVNNGNILNAVANRMKGFEKAAGESYFIAATVALSRGGSKKNMETKVFGTEKPSSTFNNAFTYAGNFLASTFLASHRTAIADMGIDDASAYVIRVMKSHMAELKVSSFSAYAKVCKYARFEDLPPATVEEEPEDAAEEPAPAPETGNEGARPPVSDAAKEEAEAQEADKAKLLAKRAAEVAAEREAAVMDILPQLPDDALARIAAALNNLLIDRQQEANAA